MEFKKSKLFDFQNTIYLWIIGIFDFIIILHSPIIGGLGFLVLLYLLYYTWITSRRQKKKWQSYIEALSSDIDSAAKYAILNLPFPLTLVNLDGEIKWYNSKFNDMMDQNDLIGSKIEESFPELNIDDLIHEDEECTIQKNGRIYRLHKNIVRLSQNKESNKGIDYIMMLYWIDITDFKKLEEKYEDKYPVIASIEIDNYDEFLKEIKDEEQPMIISQIQKEINLWAVRINGFIQKTHANKYTIIFEKKYLKNLEAKRFSILDSIREIDKEVSISPTLSVGVAAQGNDFKEIGGIADAALELSLARGGDQVAVYKNDDYQFYGGKSKAVEKRNRVKARNVAHAMVSIIDESSNIIIMGHNKADMDCYGAAIGMYRGVEDRGKEVHILLNEVSEGIEDIHEIFKNNHDYRFITNEEAEEIIDDNTLLIVVDTYRPSFTENPELLDKIKRVIVIDHHRRGKEVIEDTLLIYQEPYASSTCELVTELLQYLNQKTKISKIEAEALLAGIYVDTKNFSYQTGVRTFEAASFLRRQEADTEKVKALFQDNLEEYINRAYIISNAEIYNENIAISIFDKENVDKKQILAAQGADQLLTIKGIEASFVLGKTEEGEVFISGRSKGNISVQLILERLGGGGHLNVAGAQFEGKSLEEVKEMLLTSINESSDKEEE
jgi:c-di-AMP phosphodiesterase-like protein